MCVFTLLPSVHVEVAVNTHFDITPRCDDKSCVDRIKVLKPKGHTHSVQIQACCMLRFLAAAELFFLTETSILVSADKCQN